MRRASLGMPLLAVPVLVLFGITVFCGSAPLAFADVRDALFGVGDPFAGDVVWQIRIPKACAALFSGGSLAVSGLVLQSVFKNPLAGPFVLGVNSGANLGVALVLLAGFGGSSFGVVPFAAVGAFSVVLLVLFASKFVTRSVSLLIIGLMVGYFVDAVVSCLMVASSAESLRGFVSWGLGSFSRVALADVSKFAAVTVCGILPCALGIRYLNAAQIGDSFARSLGIRVGPCRMFVLFGASLLAAGSTVYCGPIAFLGLASPHIAFGIFRTTNHRVLIPASALVGANLALLSGLVPKIPLSSVTSLVGAPVVLWIFLRTRRGGENA